MNLAPVVLFVYNRPHHTKQVLDALSKNVEASDTTLFVYCDGAKNNATAEEILKIEQVRKIVRAEKRFKNLFITEHENNNGLATSITQGVSEILNKYENIIVLEDDLVTSPFFLSFMNEALTIYESYDDVACISGYIYPVKGKLPVTFFLKGADCWGWATWKRGWNIFEPDGKILLEKLQQQSLTDEFDFNNSYPFTQMLQDQVVGKNDSWAIRWYASAFLKNKYCLYPGKTMVQNIGIDGSGIHSGISNNQEDKLSNSKIKVEEIKIEENKTIKNVITKHFNSLYHPSVFQKIIKKIVG